MTNPDLSLAGGAVRGWDRRNAYYYQMVQALGRHYRFDPETPYLSLPERARHVLLYGSSQKRSSSARQPPAHAEATPQF